MNGHIMAGILPNITDVTRDGSETTPAANTIPLSSTTSKGSNSGHCNRGIERRRKRQRPKTLKRRLQNRMAQRRYREKQARIVAELRNLATGAHESEPGDGSSNNHTKLDPSVASRDSTRGSDCRVTPSPSLSDRRGEEANRDMEEEVDDRMQTLEARHEASGEHTIENGLDLEFSQFFIPEITRVFDEAVALPWELCGLETQRQFQDQGTPENYRSTSTGTQYGDGYGHLAGEKRRVEYSLERNEHTNSSGYREEQVDVRQSNFESDRSRLTGHQGPYLMTTSSNSDAVNLLPAINIDTRFNCRTSAGYLNDYGSNQQNKPQPENFPRHFQFHGTYEKSLLTSRATKRNRKSRNTNRAASSELNHRPFSRDQTPSTRLQLSSSLSSTSPHNSNLRLTRIPIRDAYLSIAHALGFHIPSLYDPTCQSPFYRPRPHSPSGVSSTITSEDPRASIAHLSAHIPEHLRPTPPQVLCPHHPYLDLLPFPMLRARAIALAARRPPLIDAGRLKQDLMEGGLICWSTTAAMAGSGVDGGAGGGKGVGRAWDVRCWEAAPWFLKRWGLLVGGRDGEVWRQSAWWRGFRGEEEVGEGV